jgi:hypothetical protein
MAEQKAALTAGATVVSTEKRLVAGLVACWDCGSESILAGTTVDATVVQWVCHAVAEMVEQMAHALVALRESRWGTSRAGVTAIERGEVMVEESVGSREVSKVESLVSMRAFA